MSGVDNRIVTMQFNNREFESNARTSMSTLAKLKESMNFGSIVGGTIRGLGAIQGALSKIGLKTPFAPLITGANKGLGLIGGTLDRLGMKNPFGGGIQGASDLQRAAQVAGGPGGMGVLEGGVTAVSGKFIALTTIAITALSNITNKAISAGTTFLKSFTVAPILDGLHEYETTLQSIQTVMANTDRPLPEVEDALQRLNKYSDTTIYNFGQMAKNVGTFTAAGVDLETSVASIQGIANIAALSGSSAEQAATAMYQLSQAIASGKVGLMDWNSVVNAGMGGKKLQNALAQTAVAMGEIDAASVKLVGPMEKLEIKGQSFRESIMAQPGEESWLSSDILVNTLASLDGRFSVAYQKAQLTEQGVRQFTDAQIKSNMAEARANLEKKNGVKFSDKQYAALLKMAEASTKAAQDVKTLGQVFDIAKETIGSGWAASFKSIFGNLKQSKTLFTGMSNGLGDIIRKNALARNELLASWEARGGRTDLIDGLKNAWDALLGILGPIKKGFRDIFPRNNVKDLLSMTEGFKNFTEGLIPGKQTMKDIRDIAGGVFAVFGIGKTLLGGVVTLFKTIFDTVGGGNGDFLSFAAGVGDVVKRFDEFLKNSGIVTAFFEGLGQILSVPLALLLGVGDVLGSIFSGFDTGTADAVGKAVDGVGNRLSGLQVIGERIRSFFEKVGDIFGGLGKTIGNALMGIGDMIASMFTADTFGSTLDVINTTLLGALVLLIKNFFTKGVKVDLTGGLFDGIKQTLGEATGAFAQMQNTLKADIIMKLAIAIAVMAAALLVLSTIDPAALAKALGAMSVGFAILIGAIAALMKVLGPVGLVQLYVVTSAMTKMAFSILLLSFALKTLAGINFGDMLRGLVGLAGMLFILTKALVPLSANAKGMARASFSLILVGIAINILAVALKIFASMSWEEMAKGLAGLTGVLIALGIGLKLMPPLQAEALGLIALGVALNLIAIALKVFATMTWEEMAKGLIMLAGSLLIISAAVNTMPKTMLLQAAALLVVSGALVILAGALKIMGGMGWEEIGKGMTVLAGAMLILGVALSFMGPSSILSAVAILIVAGALTVLVPVLVTLGSLQWGTLLKGLAGLALIFVILGAAGYALAPVAPVIVALGAALVLLGAGLLLAGAGAFLAATAFGIVVAAGSAGIQILVGLLASLIAAIPPAMKAFGDGVVRFAVAIGEGAPRIAAAFGQLLSNMIGQVIKNTPKLGRMFTVMLNTALKVIGNAIPRIANTGLKLIEGFLNAVDKRLPHIIDLAASIIVKFIDGIARNIDDIIDSGVRLILAFMRGVTKAIREHDKEFGEAGGDLAVAIVEGVVNGLKAGAGRISDAAVDAAKAAWQAAKDFFKIGSPSRLMHDTVGIPITQGMAGGIKAGSGMVVKEIGDLGTTTVGKMGEVMSGINDAFALDPNLNPTITPVLDLAALTQEANKMSSILATAPIMASVSYQAAADISAMTQASADANNGSDGTDGTEGGKGDVSLTLELHSPKPIDSVESYRAGKTLISLAKEALQ